MTWIAELLGPYRAYAGAVVFFTLAEALWPRMPRPLVRRGTATDWAFTLCNGYVLSPVRGAAVAAMTILVATTFGSSADRWMYGQSLWVQVPLAVIAGDFAFYWQHRALHGSATLWQLHRVHHSSVELDWLSGPRQNFVETIVQSSLSGCFMAIFGFSPEAMVAWGIFHQINEPLTHSNLPLRFAFLRYVLTTPETHRWHHSSDSRVHMKNFAAAFAFWDVLFGTLFFPRDEAPQRFGLSDDRELGHRGFLYLQAIPARRFFAACRSLAQGARQRQLSA